MAARVVEVRDALAALVNAAWTFRESEDDEVSAGYRFEIDAAGLVGRKVFVLPSAYAIAPATRADDRGDYVLTLVVVERYTAQGDPTNAWVNARCEFVEWLHRLAGDPRNGRLLATVDGDGLWPDLSSVETVYDLEELTQRKLFLSVVSVTYREEG